jgi:pimeloyl-ACP methyl ester carboxylesterase
MRGCELDEQVGSRDTVFSGAGGVRLAAEIWGAPESPTVLMLHGGGQHRHSWKDTSAALARAGLQVVSLDARGHGDSDWSADGDYGLPVLRDDVLQVIDTIDAPVVIVGASLGGLTGLLVAQDAGPERVRALALIDVVPRYEKVGSARIRHFMQSGLDGFARLEDAADAVADYLPHRPRPRSVEGLRRNLRQHADGRWYWHWDPRMMTTKPSDDPANRLELLEDAARALTIPVLLVHGRLSDVVTEAGANDFKDLVRDARVVHVAGAGHTAAGDDNDEFSRVVIDFCLTTTSTQERR